MSLEPTEMEVRVARAISRDINQHQLDTGFAFELDFPENKGGLERDWEEYLLTARIAIRAMREPTKEMGLEKIGVHGELALNIWQAMIDAASPQEE